MTMILAAMGGEGTFTASLNPETVSGIGGGTPQTVTSNSTQATGAGGRGPYTYLWSAVSNPDGITIDSTTSDLTTFSKSLNTSESATGTFKCTLTDSIGRTAETQTVDVNLINGA